MNRCQGFRRVPEPVSKPVEGRGLRVARVGVWQTRAYTRTCAFLSVVTLSLVTMGCGSSEEHGHSEGTHGGIIVPVGRDHYHAEALFTPDGELRLFMLGQEDSQVIDVETQTIQAFVRQPGDAGSKEMSLAASPQSGDAEGRTSAFTGKLPDGLAVETILVVVPSITIEGQRYRFSFQTTDPLMPQKITDDAERELYLVAGGLYTEDDITANGAITASDKYDGFRSMHDSNPQAGDLICPITGTKANPACTWIVGGQEYQFCCPPCVDEFVARAKAKPDQIKPAKSYVKQ